MKTVIEYIKTLFEIGNEAAAGIILTLFTLVLGYIINGTLKYIDSYFRRRNYRFIFKSFADEIALSCGKQADNFRKFSEQLNPENGDNFSLKYTTITHLDNIEKIDIKLFFDSHQSGIENIFFRRKKLRSLNEIFEMISAVRRLEDLYSVQYKAFMERFNHLEDKRNEYLDVFRGISDQMITETNGRTFEGEMASYLQAYDQIMYQWQIMDNRTNHKIIHESLVTPLILLNRRYPSIHYTTQMNNYLLNVDHFYSSILELLKTNKSQFEHNAELYKRAVSKIVKSLEMLY